MHNIGALFGMGAQVHAVAPGLPQVMIWLAGAWFQIQKGFDFVKHKGHG
jgi:hypothetical protein